MSEGHAELEADIVDAVDSECTAPVGGIAVVCSQLESEIALVERMPCEAYFRRNIETPLAVLECHGRQISVFLRIIGTEFSLEIRLELFPPQTIAQCSPERDLIYGIDHV